MKPCSPRSPTPIEGLLPALYRRPTGLQRDTVMRSCSSWLENGCLKLVEVRMRNLRCNYVWYDENLDMLQPKRTFWGKGWFAELGHGAYPQDG